MAFGKAQKFYAETLANIKNDGLLKEERFIHSSQSAEIKVEYPEGGEAQSAINMCANNYLGLSSHPDVVAAAHEGLDSRGYGMSSVRSRNGGILNDNPLMR